MVNHLYWAMASIVYIANCNKLREGVFMPSYRNDITYFSWLHPQDPMKSHEIPWPLVSNASKTPGKGGRGAIDKRDRLASANACVQIPVMLGLPRRLDDGTNNYPPVNQDWETLKITRIARNWSSNPLSISYYLAGSMFIYWRVKLSVAVWCLVTIKDGWTRPIVGQQVTLDGPQMM